MKVIYWLHFEKHYFFFKNDPQITVVDYQSHMGTL